MGSGMAAPLCMPPCPLRNGVDAHGCMHGVEQPCTTNQASVPLSWPPFASTHESRLAEGLTWSQLAVAKPRPEVCLGWAIVVWMSFSLAPGAPP